MPAQAPESGHDATIGDNWGGQGPWRPHLVMTGGDNPLFFKGLPVRWADADHQQYPDVSKMVGSEYRVGPGPTTAQGAQYGLRFASALNTALLKLRRPHTTVTIAVPRPTAGDIPNQQPAALMRTRGMITPVPAARPVHWNAVGGGTSDGSE